MRFTTGRVSFPLISLRALALAGLSVSPWVGAQGLPEAASTETTVSDKAESQQAAAPKFNYAIGAIVGSSPDYAGGDGRKNSLRPAWAIEYGRFRLSTSRGSAFMGHGLGPRESGASATLAQSDRFSLSAALRIDKGRDGSDAPILVGLPSVRSTLRARISVGYAITDRWAVGAGVSQDILGRDGGAQGSTSIGYTWPVTEQTKVSFGAGASFGDRTYLRGHFGVPAGGSSPLPAFEPRGGLYSVDAGVEVMTALNRHWVVLGAARVSQLQGDARRSPLTVQPVGYSVSVGLAYRCCR